MWRIDQIVFHLPRLLAESGAEMGSRHDISARYAHAVFAGVEFS